MTTDLKAFLLNILPENIKKKVQFASIRSKKIAYNVFLSSLCSGVSLLTSFLIVPLTINYVNPTQYGIWMAISSVIGWISIINLGLGNGFRNKFAEAKAKGNNRLAREYLSTTYFALSCIIILAILLIQIVNSFLDWSSILNVSQEYKYELRKVFGIVACFFCMTMVVRIFNTMLIADQKPGLASVVDTIGSICSLAAIFLLSQFTTGSLLNLALYYSGIPCLVILLASLYTFCTSKYKYLSPKISYIRVALIKDILNLGLKFFVIQICLISTFQIINIVISREVGPEAVTQYNISYRYFNIIYTVMSLVMAPFWSAFTDAYVQHDYDWMKNSLRSLERCCLFALLVGLVMLAMSNWFYRIWIGDSVSVPFLLSVGSMFYTLSMITATIYMLPINGIGTLKIQLIIYIVFALSSWILMTLSCRLLGLYGIVLVPIIVYLIQALLGKIQLTKILNKTAFGIWLQ